MRNILEKVVSIVTTLAMVFGFSSVALAEDFFNNFPPAPVCQAGVNLINNGSFETPVVSDPAKWDIFSGFQTGWIVLWNGLFVGAPFIPKMELHRGVNSWTASDGEQYTELDSDWGGPSSNQNGEQASVRISQVVYTIPGADYTLSYDFSPRPGTPAADNNLEVRINGSVVQTTGPVAGGGANSWTTYNYSFTGGGLKAIEFRDIGTPNSVGTFLDNVSVECNPVCMGHAPLYARVKIPNDTKWRNWGPSADFAPDIYVGGDQEANRYDSNEWFPLVDGNGNYINDADISGYADVPGMAVQRMSGKLRVVLYGFHNEGNGELGDKEFAAGVIELSKDGVNRIPSIWTVGNSFVDPINPTTRVHDVTVNDADNPMDARGSFNGYIDQYNERFDNVRTTDYQFQYHLVATTGSDGFYAAYNFDDMVEVPCEQNPQ